MNVTDVHALSGGAQASALGCASACCLFFFSSVVLVTVLVRRNRKKPNPSGRSWFSLRDKES